MNTQLLKEKFQRGIDLVEEYERAIKAEKCDYQLVKQPDARGRFFLIRFSDEKIVSAGPPTRICSYMNLRNIQPEVVLDFDIKEAK